jgi:hypothetical protein
MPCFLGLHFNFFVASSTVYRYRNPPNFESKMVNILIKINHCEKRKNSTCGVPSPWGNFEQNVLGGYFSFFSPFLLTTSTLLRTFV